MMVAVEPHPGFSSCAHLVRNVCDGISQFFSASEPARVARRGCLVGGRKERQQEEHTNAGSDNQDDQQTTDIGKGRVPFGPRRLHMFTDLRLREILSAVFAFASAILDVAVAESTLHGFQ
jgi:hypothetical protein